MSKIQTKMMRGLCVCGTALLLTACAVKPEPLSLDQHVSRAQTDMTQIYQDIAPVTAEITLSDAIARGLLYNLDHRMMMMERVLQDGQLTLANFNMLPRLAANAGYKSRSEVRASKSIGLRTGTVSLDDSYSEERDVFNADLTVSWNLLDFGLGYFQAKQQADRVMTAVERRRKVMNNMVKEIMIAYWKAATAEQVLPQVETLLGEAEDALKTSKAVEARGLESPMMSLEYRRNLLQVVSQLKRIKGEMVMARAQLASLINIPPQQEFTIAKLERNDYQLPKITRSVSEFQNYGLAYRPELREEAYQRKIDLQNVNKEILRMFPGLSMLASANHDSNEYLYYQEWGEFTTRLTWNLINVIQGPTAIKNAKKQVEIADMRRMALTAAVLGQVAISYTQYQQATDHFYTTSQLSTIEHKMLKITANKAKAKEASKLEYIHRQARSIAANIERNRALVDAKSSLYNLMISVGGDLISGDTETQDLPAVTEKVDDALKNMHSAEINNWIIIKDAKTEQEPKAKPDTKAVM